MVRDAVMNLHWGTNFDSKDFDVEVFGMTQEQLTEVLSQFGKVETSGERFAVTRVSIKGEQMDFSLPRRDVHVGDSHTDVEVEVDPFMDKAEASARRDVTVNSMMFNPVTGEFIDNHNGVTHIRNRVLKHTSEQFSEDILRVLRIFQMAGRFNMTVHPDTVELCRGMKDRFDTLTQNAVKQEIEKWASKSVKPSMGLVFLRDCGWLELVFPEVHALVGVPQDKLWHPEGVSLSFEISKVTSMAGSTISVASGTTFGQLADMPFAVDAPVESSNSKLGAMVGKSNRIDGLTFALNTRDFGSFKSTFALVTVVAKPMTFMGVFGTPTFRADKVVRVVFEVPFSRVHPVMLGSANQHEVFRDIVELVAVNMMNVFPTFQRTSDYDLHNITMNSDRIPIGTIGSTHVFVPVFVVDAMLDSIDDNIVFAFDLCMSNGNNICDDNSPIIMDSNVLLHNYNMKIIANFVAYLHEFTNPEGDVFTHTCHVCDAVAFQDGDMVDMFAGLGHDVGKEPNTWLQPKTEDAADKRIHWSEVKLDSVEEFQVANWGEEWRFRSPAHDTVGAPIAQRMVERWFMDADQKKCAMAEEVAALTKAHMNHIGFIKNASRKRVARLARKVNLKRLAILVNSDTNGRPFNPDTFAPNPDMVAIMAIAADMNVEDKPPVSMLTGKHLIAMGLKPGHLFGEIIRAADDAQDAGEFVDAEGAVAWAGANVKRFV